MPTTTGYVGTIESETEGTARLWFGLTATPDGADWVKIGRYRAWFTMNMEGKDRPSEMAKLTLLLEAMRSGLHVEVAHGGATGLAKRMKGDSFECTGVRILRRGLGF